MRWVRRSSGGELEGRGDEKVVVCICGGGGGLGLERGGVAILREAGGFEEGFARGLGGFLEGCREAVESSEAEYAA
jgi:hypothetical protein